MTQSIPTGQIDKSKKLFIASGVLAVLYAVLPLFTYGSIPYWTNFLPVFLEFISLSLLGIYCIARQKNDTITTVLAVLPFLFQLISRGHPYITHYSLLFPNNQFGNYFTLIRILLLVVLLLLPLISFTSRKNLNTAKTLWIVELIFSVISLLSYWIPLVETHNWQNYFSTYFQYFPFFYVNLMIDLMPLIFPAFVACFGQACITSSPVAQASKPLTFSDGYCDMTKHVLLLLFTFGIWQYIWIYRTTEYLNTVSGEEKRNPITKLLLCMFVPFYYIYWVYQSAKRIDALARQNGVASDISTVSTVLAIFIGFVPPILMQSKLNQICAGKGYPAYAASPAPQPAYQAAPQLSYQPQSNYQPQPQTNYQPQSNYQVPAAPAQPTASDTADELRKLKSLLDDGIITPEEFDAKKKQLLGL